MYPPPNYCQKTQKPPYELYGGFFYVLSRLLGDNKHRNVPNKPVSYTHLESGIRTQLYSEQKKFKHKIGYADKMCIRDSPKGILIGTVESVQPEESGLSYYACLLYTSSIIAPVRFRK